MLNIGRKQTSKNNYILQIIYIGNSIFLVNLYYVFKIKLKTKIKRLWKQQ